MHASDAVKHHLTSLMAARVKLVLAAKDLKI